MAGYRDSDIGSTVTKPAGEPELKPHCRIQSKGLAGENRYPSVPVGKGVRIRCNSCYALFSLSSGANH